MKDYTKASVKISTSLAALNIGQNVIFSTALTTMMYLAAQGIVKGAFFCEVVEASALTGPWAYE
jgi:ATP-binding cassette subfamily B (MDR/TAP) protein 7